MITLWCRIHLCSGVFEVSAAFQSYEMLQSFDSELFWCLASDFRVVYFGGFGRAALTMTCFCSVYSRFALIAVDYRLRIVNIDTCDERLAPLYYEQQLIRRGEHSDLLAMDKTQKERQCRGHTVYTEIILLSWFYDAKCSWRALVNTWFWYGVTSLNRRAYAGPRAVFTRVYNDTFHRFSKRKKYGDPRGGGGGKSQLWTGHWYGRCNLTCYTKFSMNL